MRYNSFIKFLCSIPIILIFIYFVPFLGICLLLLRCFIYNNQKRAKTPIILIGVATLILIPKLLSYVFELIKLNTVDIPYYDDLINSNLYNIDLINYSKRLFIFGIVYLIISKVLTSIFNKVDNAFNSGFMNFVNKSIKSDAEISKQNDFKIKEKQERAKNTSYVKCPSCGSDNLLAEKFGTCKYCRKKIENKNFKV